MGWLEPLLPAVSDARLLAESPPAPQSTAVHRGVVGARGTRGTQGSRAAGQKWGRTPILRVQTFPCTLPKAEADAPNQESGRVYTTTLVWHYRISRRTGPWLSAKGLSAGRLEDSRGTHAAARWTAAMPPSRAAPP